MDIDDEGIPINKYDLPYAGDLQLAFRSQASQSDIRMIIKWKNKYDQPSSPKKTPSAKEFSICTNSVDYISQDVWSHEHQPDFFINYMSDDETIGPTFCYIKEDLAKL